MPLNYDDYPDDWHAISRRIRRERAGNRCECRGECGRDHGGRCPALNHHLRFEGEDGPFYVRKDDEAAIGAICAWNEEAKGVLIVLTVAHLWRGPCEPCHLAGIKCGIEDHLAAFCQGCHLIYDLEHHKNNARRTRAARVGQLWFDGLEDWKGIGNDESL